MQTPPRRRGQRSVTLDGKAEAGVSDRDANRTLALRHRDCEGGLGVAQRVRGEFRHDDRRVIAEVFAAPPSQGLEDEATRRAGSARALGKRARVISWRIDCCGRRRVADDERVKMTHLIERLRAVFVWH